VSPVTGDAKKGFNMSRNSIYEAKQKEKGLKKITLWVPEESADDLKLMASICCENKKYYPSMIRNSKNGQLKSINSNTL
jgi:hypothetical protein